MKTLIARHRMQNKAMVLLLSDSLTKCLASLKIATKEADNMIKIERLKKFNAKDAINKLEGSDFVLIPILVDADYCIYKSVSRSVIVTKQKKLFKDNYTQLTLEL